MKVYFPTRSCTII